MAATAFEAMTVNQQAAVSRLQRSIAEINLSLAAAAEAGVEIELSTLDATFVGSAARVVKVRATAGLPVTAI